MSESLDKYQMALFNIPLLSSFFLFQYSLPKMRIADILRKPSQDHGGIQDFSMGSKTRGGGGNNSNHSMNLSQTSPTSGKGKLNDMLSKLMKKNNVPPMPMEPEEPQAPLSKEKKRRKLDEIVLGLSAAKQPEQKSIFGDPGLTLSSSKKPQITPSVSVTPANIPSAAQQSHMNQNQKPFTITVTSVPGKGKSDRDNKSFCVCGRQYMKCNLTKFNFPKQVHHRPQRAHPRSQHQAQVVFLLCKA